MPATRGVLETSLYVEDLDRAEQFYADLFRFQRMVGDERFRALNVEGRQVLLLFLKGAASQAITFEGGTIPPHDGDGTTHLAFAVDADQLPEWEKAIRAAGVSVESRVVWSRGGKSVYFRDPDGHLLELVTPGCWPIW